jgi:hypothetical protein
MSYFKRLDKILSDDLKSMKYTDSYDSDILKNYKDNVRSNKVSLYDINDFKLRKKFDDNRYYSRMDRKDNDMTSNFYMPSSQPTSSFSRSSIRSSGIAQPGVPVAYVNPTEEEMNRVLSGMAWVQSLPATIRPMFSEVFKNIRIDVDGDIRMIVGGTQHYTTIRALNNPQTTTVTELLPRSVRNNVEGNVQLVSEEYFGVNRHVTYLPDVADIEWQAVFNSGDWHLETWNDRGEHQSEGLGGAGELVGGSMKLNGKLLTPEEIVSFGRTIKRRKAGQAVRQVNYLTNSLNKFGLSYGNDAAALLQVKRFLKGMNGDDPYRFDSADYEKFRQFAETNGLINDSNALTFVGGGMISAQTARRRKDGLQMLRGVSAPSKEIENLYGIKGLVQGEVKVRAARPASSEYDSTLRLLRGYGVTVDSQMVGDPGLMLTEKAKLLAEVVDPTIIVANPQTVLSRL